MHCDKNTYPVLSIQHRPFPRLSLSFAGHHWPDLAAPVASPTMWTRPHRTSPRQGNPIPLPLRNNLLQIAVFMPP